MKALLQHALSLVLAQGHREGIPGVEHEVREASIVVGGRTLTVTAVPENFAKQQGQYLCAVRFEVSCEGAPLPAFSMGAVGNDVEIGGAFMSAAHEWYMLFGAAMICSFAQGPAPLALLRHGAYPGSLLVRGTPPGGWVDGSGAMHERILSGIEGVVRSHPGDVRAVSLQFAISESGEISGDCRINGVNSEPLLNAVRRMGWPKSTGPWMLKQFYLLSPIQTTAQLHQRPQGKTSDNKWEESLRRAQELIDEAEYEAARSTLENQLMESRNLEGLAADRYRSITLGLLSKCLVNGGKPELALAPARSALELCEKSGDLEGIATYRMGLFEIQRYQGRPAEAARLAESVAEVLETRGQTAEAQRWRRDASIIKAGEPLCRIVITIGAGTYEIDEAPPPGPDGRVRFGFRRNRLSIGCCESRMKKGKELGIAGRPEEALVEFQEAASLDPFDPEPHYQSGCALMDLERFADAAEEFRATEELAPGWYHCRRDLWLAEQIALGKLPKEVYAALRALEANQAPPQDRLAFVEKAMKSCPAVAPLHLWHGDLLAALGHRDQAVAAYRCGLNIADEPDIRTNLLVNLALMLAGKEQSELLQEACTLRGNLVSAAYAAYTLRIQESSRGALADCTKAIDIDPKHGVVCYNRGLARLAKDDLDGALADFTEAIDLDPKNVNAYDCRGNVRQAKGDLDGAIADHSRAIDLDPKNLSAYYNRGNERQAKGDLDGAIADYTKAIDLDPKNYQAYHNRGAARQAKGDLDGAIADYTKAIDIDPKHGLVYFGRGAARKAKGDVDGALADFTKAIDLDSKDGEFYFGRGVAREAKGDLDGAIADYTKVIDLDPKNVAAYNNRGNVRQANDDLDGAIADCTRAIELDPNLAVAYLNRGLAKLVKADLDGAIGDYSRAVELNPNLADAYRNRGFAKKYKNDLDGALADYTKAIDLDPKNVEAYYNRGVARVDKGDLDGALADYTKAIDLDPKHVDAYGNRGYVRYDLGTWAEALDDFRKRCELGTQGQEYLRLRIFLARARLGERIEATQELSAYWRERKSPTPIDWVTKIASFLTQLLSEEGFIKAADSKDGKLDKEQHCEAYFYMGTMSLIEGKKEKAREYFQKCLDTGVKHFFEYRSAEAELRMLEKSE